MKNSTLFVVSIIMIIVGWNWSPTIWALGNIFIIWWGISVFVKWMTSPIKITITKTKR